MNNPRPSKNEKGKSVNEKKKKKSDSARFDQRLTGRGKYVKGDRKREKDWEYEKGKGTNEEQQNTKLRAQKNQKQKVYNNPSFAFHVHQFPSCIPM